MSRVAAAALMVLAVLGSAGCADNLLKERPVEKATRAPSTKAAFSAVGSARGESSVCSAYRRQLRLVQLRQRLQSGKAITTELQARALSLNAVIADACE